MPFKKIIPPLDFPNTSFFNCPCIIGYKKDQIITVKQPIAWAASHRPTTSQSLQNTSQKGNIEGGGD